VKLRVPADTGSRWTAHPNSPWLRVDPAEGESKNTPRYVTVTLTPGDHPPRLHRGAVTFRTDRGFCRTVMVDARVYPADYVALAVEAEDGQLTGVMKAAKDPTASGGAFIHGLKQSDDDEGTARFAFDVPGDGTYYIVGRTMVPEPLDEAGSHDSFLLSVDDGEKLRWDLPMWSAGTWLWDRASGYRSRHAPFRFALKRGRHTVVVGVRESLARLDRLVLTNAPYAAPAASPAARPAANGSDTPQSGARR